MATSGNTTRVLRSFAGPARKALLIFLGVFMVFAHASFGHGEEKIKQENVTGAFDIVFGDNLPYPVQWLSGKTVHVVDGRGYLQSQNAPPGPDYHFNEEYLNFNNVYLIISIIYNEQTGIISGAILGQSSTQDPNIKNHYEVSILDKKISKTVLQGELSCIASGGNVFIDFHTKKVKHSDMGYAMPDFSISYTLELIEDETVIKLPDSGARFSDLSGQVEILIPSGYDKNGEPVYDHEDWNFAKLDMELPYGTQIRTAERSSAKLSFGDMSTFVQKEDTTIILGKATGDADNQLELLGGELWFNIKETIKKGSLRFDGSQATTGIKGTVFTLEEKNNTTIVRVIAGSVEFKSKSSGETQTVNAGETVTATAQGLSQKSNFDQEAEVKKWEQYIEKPKPTLLVFIAAGLLVTAIAAGYLVYRRKRKISIRRR